MEEAGALKVLFVAGFGPIVRDAASSRKLYEGDLGLAFTEESGGYLHTEALPGAKAFALWPLAHVAQSCFGSDRWPGDIPVPQAWLEFEVEDIERATAALAARGHRLLVRLKREPWGQTVSRFLSPEGLLVAVTVTPWMRDGK
jgi:catechol 2,3-dioxygenase-like lactoylglutathione lyase family enzyme